MRPFDKYERWGDYHWKEFENDTPYRNHALYVQDWITEKDVLDIGCGDGLITSLIGAKGIDIHELAVFMAVKHGVQAEVGDVYNLSGNYEAVYFGDVIEHLEYPEKAMEQIGKITDIVYIATPPKSDVLSSHHYKEYTQEELKEFIEGLGWEQTYSDVKYERIYAKFKKSLGTARE
jgi:SAM-dependent methyltransferase